MDSLFEYDANDSPFHHDRDCKMAGDSFQRDNECQKGRNAPTQLLRPKK